jgi:hypothetical protein
VKYSEYHNALNEIEEYLAGYDDESCGKSFGMKLDGITGDKDLLDKIAAKLIKTRINGETADDIYDAIREICKRT